MGVEIRLASGTKVYTGQGDTILQRWGLGGLAALAGGQDCSRLESSAGTRHLPEPDLTGQSLPIFEAG
jgi:hypothetical protein